MGHRIKGFFNFSDSFACFPGINLLQVWWLPEVQKDHKAMILLKAYKPEEAQQVIFHLEIDSLRECFLPQAINILAEKDIIETATKQKEAQEPEE